MLKNKVQKHQGEVSEKVPHNSRAARKKDMNNVQPCLCHINVIKGYSTLNFYSPRLRCKAYVAAILNIAQLCYYYYYFLLVLILGVSIGLEFVANIGDDYIDMNSDL